MKISKQQIDIIANAMVKELRDDTKAFEEAKKEAQVYIKSFKKSKFYKELEQVFKFWYINQICLKCSDFCKITCPELLWDNTSNYCNWYTNMDDILAELENKLIRKLKKQIPSEWELKEKIVLELTLKSLWADDIYAVLEDIKASIKKQFYM